MVKRLGGVNISDLLMPMDEKLAYAPLSLEAISTVQPDVILCIDHQFGEITAQGVQTLSHLDGVQQKRIYRLPHSLFAVNPGAQIEKALTILAGCLYHP